MAKRIKQYFSHDADARSGDDMRPMLMKHGMIGYGIYWSLWEMLRKAPNYKMRTQCECIAYDLRVDCETVASVINDFNLFVVKGDFFWSKDLLECMKIMEEKSEKAKNAANIRHGRNRNADAMRTHYERNASAMQIKETKLNKKKKEKPARDPDKPDARRLSVLLFNKIKSQDPKAKAPNWTSWDEDMEKLIRIDGRTVEDIEFIIKWCQDSDFWRKNILSASKLREKFTTLWVQSRDDAPKPKAQPEPEIDFEKCQNNVSRDEKSDFHCVFESKSGCEYAGTGYCKKYDVQNPQKTGRPEK